MYNNHYNHIACILNAVQLIPNYMITITLGNINNNIHTEIANQMYHLSGTNYEVAYL